MTVCSGLGRPPAWRVYSAFGNVISSQTVKTGQAVFQFSPGDPQALDERRRMNDPVLRVGLSGHLSRTACLPAAEMFSLNSSLRCLPNRSDITALGLLSEQL